MLSIIIPAYKELPLLRTALNSVLMQKNVEYEVVIVDDSPEDEIEDYCHTLQEKRVRYHHNQPSKGAVPNWNYGISLAKGNKIILLHHDEAFIHDTYLSHVDKLLDQYDICVHNKKVMVDSKEKRDKIPEILKRLLLNYPQLLFAANCIGPCACVAYRKDIHEKFDEYLKWFVDVDWYFRLLKKSKRIYYLETKEIVSYHGHKDQITENIDILKTFVADTVIINKKYKSLVINFCLMLGKLLLKLK